MKRKLYIKFQIGEESADDLHIGISDCIHYQFNKQKKKIEFETKGGSVLYAKNEAEMYLKWLENHPTLGVQIHPERYI